MADASVEIALRPTAALPIPTAGAPLRDRLAFAFLVEYAPKTARAYRFALQRLFRWCDQHNVDALALRRLHITAWRTAMEEEGCARRSIEQRLGAVRAFYAYCLTEQDENDLQLLGVHANPVKPFKRVKQNESPQLGLTRDQASAMLAIAAELPTHGHAAFAILLLTGVRSFELEHATVGGYVWREEVRALKVHRKNGYEDTVRVPGSAATAIDAHLATRPSAGSHERLIIAHDGQPMTNKRQRALVARLAAAAGIRDRVTPHSMRHTFVTLALDADAPIDRVAEAAGHRNLDTTRRYDRARQAMRRSPTQQLDDFLNG